MLLVIHRCISVCDMHRSDTYLTSYDPNTTDPTVEDDLVLSEIDARPVDP